MKCKRCHKEGIVRRCRKCGWLFRPSPPPPALYFDDFLASAHPYRNCRRVLRRKGAAV